MALVTRLTCLLDIIRLSLVYYRIANGVLYLIDLITRFNIMKLIPLIVVTQFPTVWFILNIMFLQPALRRWIPKLTAGFVINKLISPAISITVFTVVLKNLGSQGKRLQLCLSNGRVSGCVYYVALIADVKRSLGHDRFDPILQAQRSFKDQQRTREGYREKTGRTSKD